VVFFGHFGELFKLHYMAFGSLENFACMLECLVE